MESHELEVYLHEHIPLSRAMGVKVNEANWSRVELAAPLAPNINHRETVFGGSASAVAILAAWSLIFVRLIQKSMASRVVIQRNVMQYERPIVGMFTASSIDPGVEVWDRFVEMLRRKKRARITIGAILHFDGKTAGEFDGDFVAFAGVLSVRG